MILEPPREQLREPPAPEIRTDIEPMEFGDAGLRKIDAGAGTCPPPFVLRDEEQAFAGESRLAGRTMSGMSPWGSK